MARRPKQNNSKTKRNSSDEGTMNSDENEEIKMTEGEGQVDFEALALGHWRSVLADKTASDTAKSSAANGLAGHALRVRTAMKGRIIRMSRADLLSEIGRVKSMLSGA